MKLSDKTITDNVTEILSSIVEFTQQRREVLSRNIFDYRKDGFRPMDLAVGEFANRLTGGLAAHLHCKKLILQDSEHIVFEPEGRFSAVPVIDHGAEDLVRNDTKTYLKEQIRKLSENHLHNRVAVELLSQKRNRQGQF